MPALTGLTKAELLSFTSLIDCFISPSPGSYLPSSYSFSPYGSKVSGGEDADKARASPSVSCKSSSESKALDILQQHASHYKSKSPTVSGTGCSQNPGRPDPGSGRRWASAGLNYSAAWLTLTLASPGNSMILRCPAFVRNHSVGSEHLAVVCVSHNSALCLLFFSR